MGSGGRPAFLRTVQLRRSAPTDTYPFDLPAVAGLDLALGPVTVFVGDNGSGKSTLIEAIAVAAGFNAEGGGRNLRFTTFATHSELHAHLELRWRQRPRWGWFLRS
ncbi:MAG: AAA family ATPase [Ilumatobacteraceae bacterium]